MAWPGGARFQSDMCRCCGAHSQASARCGAVATLTAAVALVLLASLAAVRVPAWHAATSVAPTAKAHMASACTAGPWPWHPPAGHKVPSTPAASNSTSSSNVRRSTAVGPVFVVGCGHSGTSLMTRMLGAHSRLWNYPGETGMLEKGSLARARAIGNDLQRQATEAGKARWVEKTPDHVYRIQDAFDSFTDAHVVVMVRDGRDVVASLLKRGTYSVRGACSRWSSSLTASLPWWDHPRVTVVRGVRHRGATPAYTESQHTRTVLLVCRCGTSSSCTSHRRR